MQNVKLTIAYDGTNYHGYQLQANADTIQARIEAALWKVYGSEIRPYSASRTDSGVHARGQVIHYFTEKRIPTGRLPHALNSELPNDIVVKRAEEVSPNFKARRDAKAKQYRYYVYHAPVMDPFWRNYALYMRETNLDIRKMDRAAKHFEGTHDFSPFRAVQGSDLSINPIRTIHKFRVFEPQESLLVFDVIGSGFLYKMVRIMVGTLLEIGRGSMSEQSIREILESQDRSRVGSTAKPHGLYLERIWY